MYCTASQGSTAGDVVWRAQLFHHHVTLISFQASVGAAAACSWEEMQPAQLTIALPMFFSGAASTYSPHSRSSGAPHQHYARLQLLLGHGSDSLRVGLFMLVCEFDFARENIAFIAHGESYMYACRYICGSQGDGDGALLQQGCDTCRRR